MQNAIMEDILDRKQGQRCNFSRTELLLGRDSMNRIANAKVLIFGVGGVGSWCAEGLVRNGAEHLTIVDSDCVSVSNVNRQLMATTKTVGLVKVDALKEHLLEINPNAEIVALQRIYDGENAASFNVGDYDYVVDAIDSLDNKAKLILQVTRLCKEQGKPLLFSSMGAALRMDPLGVRQSEFWDIKGDALARALRNKFKKISEFPAKKFKCVYSEETPMKNLGSVLSDENGSDGPMVEDTWAAKKAQINGSMIQVTATFGLVLSSLILKDIINKK